MDQTSTKILVTSSFRAAFLAGKPFGIHRTILVDRPCKLNKRIAGFIRLSIPPLKSAVQNENTSDESTKTIHDPIPQKFLDWRLFLNNNNSSQFQLYVLPVRV